jgi:PAS domain S-box-containing protein
VALASPFAIAAVALAFGRAVTARRRAQQEVQRIFELSLDLICVVDLEGRFVALNPSFERTLGYPPEQMLRRPFMDFVHPDDREASRERFKDVLGGDEVTHFENRYIRPDGSERWLEWSACAAPEQRAVYATARDVTERRRIDAEQAALRRVATLVARQAPQTEIFTAIAEECARRFGTPAIEMFRYDRDSTVVVASTGPFTATFPRGSRHLLGGENVSTLILQTGNAARIDDYGGASGSISDAALAMGLRSAVGAPIIVEGQLWGGLIVGVTDGPPPPPETEARLGEFTDLMATAIANTESRARAERLADEQAALRRVATLVARESSPLEVFGAVPDDVMRVLGTEAVGLLRFEPDSTATLVAQSDTPWPPPPLGTRFRLDGENLVTALHRTGQAARLDEWTNATGEVSAMANALGVRSSVATPIVVEGRLWGTLIATTSQPEPLPLDTEARLGRFADLVATAIANAEAREAIERLAEEQAASRIRLLTEADAARRRVVRDLHDGAQQRLVTSIMTLKLAQHQTDGQARSLIDEALEEAEQANSDLRELAHGILPSGLTRGGLRAGVKTVVSRLDLPVQVDLTNERFPAEIEASAYFIIAEALTNVVKHAQATRAEVKAHVENRTLLLEVRDDGVGGANPAGHGLVGLTDRSAALGGSLHVGSLASGGTLVAAALPLPMADEADSFSEAAMRPPAVPRG